MINLRFITLFVFLLAFFTVPVLGISVSPAGVDLIYDPKVGIDAEFDLKVLASSTSTGSIEINLTEYNSPFGLVDGTVRFNNSQMKQYVKISESVIDPSRQNIINVKVKIPPNTPLYGPQIFGIYLVEKPRSEAGFLTITTAALLRVSIDAPYPDQYLDINKFSIDNVNEGESSKLYWQVKGRSEKETSFSAALEIKSKNGTIVFNRDLGSESVGRHEVFPPDLFYESLPTNNFIPGKYDAVLTVKFLNNIKRSNIVFNVGTESVSLESYAPENLVYGEINEITLNVLNLWNGQFNNVFGTIEIMGENITTIKSNTPSGVLTPFGTLELKQYVDVRALPEGIYTGKITIDFDDYATSFPAKFTVAKKVIPVVVEEEEKDNSSTYLIIGICLGVAILLGLVFYLFFWKKKNGGNKSAPPSQVRAQAPAQQIRAPPQTRVQQQPATPQQVRMLAQSRAPPSQQAKPKK